MIRWSSKLDGLLLESCYLALSAMQVRWILIVYLRSMSANSGPPKTGFPAVRLTASLKPGTDTSGLEPTEACYVSTVSISSLSLLLPSPPLRTFRYCSCLPMLAEHCGSAHRAPISCTKRMASLRVSDTVKTQSPPCQKITMARVLVSSIDQGTFRYKSDGIQRLGPSSPPVISAEATDGKIWLGTLGDGLFVLKGGQPTQVNSGLPDRKINCLLAVGSDELWVGTGTGLYRGDGTSFIGSNCQRSSVMSRF